MFMDNCYPNLDLGPTLYYYVYKFKFIVYFQCISE